MIVMAKPLYSAGFAITIMNLAGLRSAMVYEKYS